MPVNRPRRRADRLMFGTDFLSPGQDVPQFEVLKQADLPEDVLRIETTSRTLDAQRARAYDYRPISRQQVLYGL